MKRCSSVALERTVLAPGSSVNPGCEVVEGSVIIKGKETFAPLFVHVGDNAQVGPNGATVICPTDDLYSFEVGERIPAGTLIVSGGVILNGELKSAPPPFTIGPDDEAYATDNTKGDDATTLEDGEGGDGGAGGAGETRGFCEDWDKIDLEYLDDIANFRVPDLEAMAIGGIQAYASELVGRLSAVLGKLTAEVDTIMTKVMINPEDACTLPVKEKIAELMEIINVLMKYLPLISKIMKVIKVIRSVIKLVMKILSWFPPASAVVGTAVKLLTLMNIIGTVDMIVGVLTQTVARFTSILPLLYQQLKSIMADCFAMQGLPPPANQKECEDRGGTWVSEDDLDKLQELNDQISGMSSEMSSGMSDEMSDTTTTEVSYCTLSQYDNKQECEANGGEWKVISTSTDFDDNFDLGELEKEMQLRLDEASACFADPTIQKYLEEM